MLRWERHEGCRDKREQMIINDKEAARRLDSPMNLINKLRSSNGRNNAMQLFGIGKKEVLSTGTSCLFPAITGEKHPAENTPAIFNPFPPAEIPLIPIENLDTILVDNDSQIKLGLAHDKALDLLNDAVAALALKLNDVKADKLPSVISAASKTVESIRRERSEASKNNKDREVHFHFYTPEQKKIADYEIIDVVGVASA